MRYRIRRIAYLSGLSGSVIIAFGTLVTALGFEGRHGEPYSFLNHFISELGEVGISRWAMVFNVGLIAGGLLLTVFMLGLAAYSGGRFGYVFGLVGLVSGISGALVGVFPMNRLKPHSLVAMMFFNVGMVSAALFAVYVLFIRQDRFRRWVAVPAIVTVVCFFAFLFLTEPAQPAGELLELPKDAFADRPAVWTTAILEWSVFFSVLAWAVIVSLYLRVQRSKTAPQHGT